MTAFFFFEKKNLIIASGPQGPLNIIIHFQIKFENSKIPSCKCLSDFFTSISDGLT